MKKLVVNIAIVVAVCGVVMVTHWPVLSAKALSFDDQQYITANVLVQNPGWASAQRFLTEVFKPSTVGGYYQPLTMISLMLDSALGGNENNLVPFHRTNLVIHVANTALVIVLLYMFFGNIWVACAVGLLFGVHPLTVEPVAWVSERKTLLAAFFAFWSLVFYLLFTRTSGKKYYVACLLAYLLAIMSKPTSLMLPLVMLLMDYWPLNRLNRRAVLEKLPLFALLLVFAAITIISQKLTSVALLPGQDTQGVLSPLLVICHNLIFYIFKIIWPANLSSYYEYPQPFVASNPYVLIGIIGTVFLIVLLAVSIRRTKAVLAGFLIFFIVILPTMQILRFANNIAYDKFVYLPSLGLLMMLACFLSRLCSRGLRLIITVAAIVLLLAGAEAMTVRRCLSYWSDTLTRGIYMLSLAPDALPLHANLATTYGQLGRYEDAAKILKRIISVNPYDPELYYNLGVACLKLNRYEQAIDAFREAVRLIPDYADAYVNLACAYSALGRFEEEIDLCNRAIKLKPDSIEAYLTLGSAYGNLGRYGDAIEAYKQALKISPRNPQSLFGLGAACFKNGDAASAMQQYEILKRLDQNLANRLHTLISAAE